MKPAKIFILFFILGFLCVSWGTAAKKEAPVPSPFPIEGFYDPEILLQDAVSKLDLAYMALKKEAHATYKKRNNWIVQKRSSKKISAAKANRARTRTTRWLENRLAFLEKNYQKTKSALETQYAALLKARQDETPTVKSMNLSMELYNLKLDCRQREKEVRRRFYQEKRAAERSLSALEKDDSERQRDLNKARKRLGKALSDIDQECAARERAMRVEYRALLKKEQREMQKSWKKEMVAQRKQALRERRLQEAEAIKKAKEFAQTKPSRVGRELPWNDFWNSWKLHGILKEEVAYRISQPAQYSKIKSLLTLSESARWSDNLRFKFSQRAFYDAVFSLTHKYPDEVQDDQEWEIELRDAFFDYSHGSVDWRVGKQQIVWGDAMALFIADIINGKDMREYVLPEFEHMRQNQWSAVVTHTEGGFTGELMASIPEFHKLGVRGSEFEFSAPLPANARLMEVETPERSPNNSDLGGRMSFLLGGLDLGVFLLHTWEKFPVYQRRWVWPSLQYVPIYERKDVFGLTFSKDIIADSILKGEFVYTPSQPFTTANPYVSDGIDHLSMLDYVVGVDHTFFDRVESNVQILQRLIQGETKYLINERSNRTHVSFYLKTDIFNGKLEPQLTAIVGLTEKDQLWRPKIVWKVSNRVRFNMGADIFIGKPNTGLFGLFEQRDRVYNELEIHF